MITVVVPVYNSEKYLEECFNSLMEQSNQKFEIILVDDGSTDGSKELCNKYASERNLCEVLHIENSGPLIARRRGIAKAAGDYILCLDSDDCLRSDAIEILEECIQTHMPDLVLFDISKAYAKTFSGAKIGSGLYHEGLYRGKNLKEIKKAVCSGDFSNLANKVIKKEVFDLECDYSKYISLKHGEDWFQVFPVIDRVSSVFYLKEQLYFYRENIESSTHIFKYSQIHDLDIVFDRLNQYSKKWGAEYLSFADVAICRHVMWLIMGITEVDNRLESKKYLLEEAFQLIKNYCNEDVEKILKSLRFDFRLPLKQAYKGNYLFVLFASKVVNCIYKMICMARRLA